MRYALASYYFTDNCVFQNRGDLDLRRRQVLKSETTTCKKEAATMPLHPDFKQFIIQVRTRNLQYPNTCKFCIISAMNFIRCLIFLVLQKSSKCKITGPGTAGVVLYAVQIYEKNQLSTKIGLT